jgi:AcrR family transcriptional regulator
MSTAAKPGPRERLLSAATDLTFTRGVGVGVDAILQKADVARRSLYQHFGGKDGLLVEVIKATSDEDKRQYLAALESGGTDPRTRILKVFDGVAKTVSTPGFQGCRYIAADLSLTDPDHVVHTETRAYREWLHRMFETELTDLGHPTPARAADELLFLVEGALVGGVTRPAADPGRTARRLAEHIVDGR